MTQYVKNSDNTVWSTGEIARAQPSPVSIPEGADLDFLGFTKLIEMPKPAQRPWHDVVPGSPVANRQIWDHVAWSPERIKAGVIDAAQKRMDAFAQSGGYDNMLSACTYANSAVPKYRIEGQYCINQRDETWFTLLGILRDVEEGRRQIPASFAELEPLLPALAWPAQ